MKTLIGSALCALALAYSSPATAANSEAYVSTEQGIFGVTVKAKTKDANIEYFIRNDKRECKLTFKYESNASLELVDTGCDQSVDTIKLTSLATGETELRRDKAHEGLFRQADRKYKSAVEENKLQEMVDDYFRKIEDYLRLMLR